MIRSLHFSFSSFLDGNVLHIEGLFVYSLNSKSRVSKNFMYLQNISKQIQMYHHLVLRIVCFVVVAGDGCNFM